MTFQKQRKPCAAKHTLRSQTRAQHIQRRIKLTRYRGLTDAHASRQFLLCATFKEALDDDRTHWLRQIRQSFIKQGFKLAPGSLFRMPVHFDCGSRLVFLAARFATHSIQRLLPCHLMQPGSDGLDGLPTAASEREKRLLRHILSQRRISRDTAGRGMNHPDVRLDQSVKCLCITIAVVSGEEM